MARRAKEAAAEVPKPPSTQAAEPTILERLKESRGGLKFLISDEPSKGMGRQDEEQVVKEYTGDWTGRPKIEVQG